MEKVWRTKLEKKKEKCWVHLQYFWVHPSTTLQRSYNYKPVSPTTQSILMENQKRAQLRCLLLCLHVSYSTCWKHIQILSYAKTSCSHRYSKEREETKSISDSLRYEAQSIYQGSKYIRLDLRGQRWALKNSLFLFFYIKCDIC